MIPQDWKEKKLEELCEIEIGKTPSRSDIKLWDKNHETENIWLSIADLNNTQNKSVFSSKEQISDLATKRMRLVKIGTLLLSFKLTIGRVAFAGKDLYTNEAIAQLPIKNQQEIDKNYLYYYLQYFDYEKLLKGDIKVKGKTLNKKKLKKLIVYYPSLPEQKRIVAKLDKAFAAIEKVKSNAEQDLNNAKELFESFLNNWISKIQPSDFVPLINVYNFIDYRGVTPNKISSGVPLITAKNVKKGYIDYTIRDFISEHDYTMRQSRGTSLKGDILFTTEAPLGNVALADLEKFSAGQRIITLQQYPNSKHLINNSFYCYFMQSKIFQNTIHSLATGATAQGIKASRLKFVNIPIVAYDEQNKIVTQLDSFQEQSKKLADICTQKIKKCEELKQSILQKAFRGEL